ncbi:MAG: hypothetical protein RJQ04_05475 [Longimicrobiales bacterium]
MFTREHALLRGLSGPLAALMLVLSVAVPVLERADVSHELAIESEHDPNTCPPVHDHTVCTQVGANHGAVADGPEHRERLVVLDLAAPNGSSVPARPAFSSGPPSRAPPVA